MSDRTLRVVSALAALALVAGIGCSSGAGTNEDSARPSPIQEPAQEPGTPPPPPDTSKALQVQASSPEMEKIAQELARGRSTADQQAIFESQQHIEVIVLIEIAKCRNDWSSCYGKI